MPDRPNKLEIVESIAAGWNSSGIGYAVMHGLENYPSSVGRDLDVIVQSDHMTRAVGIAIETLRDHGLEAYLRTYPWRSWTVSSHPGDVVIDLTPRLFWGPVLLVDGPRPDASIGPFKFDPWASFAKAVLMYVIAERPLGEPWPSHAELETVRERCEKLLGSRLSSTLLGSLATRDQIQLTSLGPQLRRTLVARSLLLRPRDALTIPWALRKAQPYLSKRTPIVALVGPDHVHRSDVLGAFLKDLPPVFLGTTVRQGAVPSGKHQHGGSVVRFLRYWLGSTATHFLRDRPRANTQPLVFYSASALDMHVHPDRFGLSARQGRLLWRLLPKPDLLMLLVSSTDLTDRDDEESLRRQADTEAWLAQYEMGRITTVVDVSTGPEPAAAEVLSLIIDEVRRLNPPPT